MDEQEKQQEQFTFTDEQQAHIQTILAAEKENWVRDELTPLAGQLEELKSKVPVEASEQEKRLLERETALLHKEIKVGLQEKGFGEFSDILNIQKTEDIDAVVAKLEQILSNRKIEGSYQGEKHKGQSLYESASDKKDTVGMIAAKLFGAR